jgi:tRNA (guanine-N7-)-methyltransferase
MTDHPPPDQPRDAAFFGRRKGRPLRREQARRVETLLPDLALPLDRPTPARLGALFPGDPDDVRLEIGFGGGEHLVHRAAEEPDAGHIGVEPFLNGMAKALAATAERGLANVRLSDADAIRVLDWLPDASLTRVVLLYPDPWPKKRHWKRRFVGADTVARLARVLRPGGLFLFASDIPSYVDWTLSHLRADPRFAWTATRPADWLDPFPGWPGTRYEAKALREGRRPAYLTFERAGARAGPGADTP